MKKFITSFILMFAIYANAQIPAPSQTNPILLKNGFIHTISKGVVEGSILFDKGKIVPKKSTYFDPKPADGLVNLLMNI